MKDMKRFFGSLFGQQQKPRQKAEPAAPARREALRQEPTEVYKKGDVIGGRYEIHALPSHRNLKKTVGNLQKTCHTAGE
jgi:hypothetical protein